MTDKDIIKALECCKKDGCDNCHNDFGNCYANLAVCSHDLINRQKAEYNNLLEQFRILDCECERLEKADENQKAEIERLKAFKSYFDELYGKGLDVENWHLNGALEPFDNFYESALQEMAGAKNDY